METNTTEYWKKCSTCKKPIALGAKYYVCSVSTCNSQRIGYVFCSMTCFEAHVPGARHRDAGAIAHTAPMTPASAAPAPSSTSPDTRAPARFIARPGATNATSAPSSASTGKVPKETLIIASRLKDYVQARAEMNTSASVMDVLSDYVRILCDRATENARADGRKTLMDRDFEFLKKP